MSVFYSVYPWKLNSGLVGQYSSRNLFFIVKQFIVRCPLIFSLIKTGEKINFLDVLFTIFKLRNSKPFLKYVQRNRKTNSFRHIYHRNLCSSFYQSQGVFAMTLIYSIFLKSFFMNIVLPYIHVWCELCQNEVNGLDAKEL